MEISLTSALQGASPLAKETSILSAVQEQPTQTSPADSLSAAALHPLEKIEPILEHKLFVRDHAGVYELKSSLARFRSIKIIQDLRGMFGRPDVLLYDEGVTFHRIQHNRAMVVFRLESERDEAIEELQESYTGRPPTSKKELGQLLYQMNRIEREEWHNFLFYGEGYCNSLSAGCILMLPPLGQTRDGYYLDPRINPGAYWHSVIITQYYGDDLWSIVVCRSFAGRSLEDAFPDDEPECYRYIEINSTFVDSKDRESNKVLILDRDKLMLIRSYAGTTSYLVGLEALGKFSGMPKIWKISNLELLKERISNVGLFYQKGDPRGHPGYRGGSVTPTDVEKARLEIQKRAKWENQAVL